MSGQKRPTGSQNRKAKRKKETEIPSLKDIVLTSILKNVDVHKTNTLFDVGNFVSISLQQYDFEASFLGSTKK